MYTLDNKIFQHMQIKKLNIHNSQKCYFLALFFFLLHVSSRLYLDGQFFTFDKQSNSQQDGSHFSLKVYFEFVAGFVRSLTLTLFWHWCYFQGTASNYELASTTTTSRRTRRKKVNSESKIMYGVFFFFFCVLVGQ